MDFFFLEVGGGYDDHPAMVLQGDGYRVKKKWRRRNHKIDGRPY